MAGLINENALERVRLYNIHSSRERITGSKSIKTKKEKNTNKNVTRQHRDEIYARLIRVFLALLCAEQNPKTSALIIINEIAFELIECVNRTKYYCPCFELFR